MQQVYDTGSIFGISSATGSTPVRLAALQEVKVNFKFSLTPNPSQYQVPVKDLVSGLEISATAKMARINGLMLAQVMLNRSFAAGATLVKVNQAVAIPAAPGPYTATITPPSSGVFGLDMGVVLAADSVPFTVVSSGPTAGKYSQAGAVYTFAAADAGKAILVSYTYTVTTGRRITIDNQFKGEASYFKAVLVGGYQGQQQVLGLNRCSSEQLLIPQLVEDWQVPEFSFKGRSDLALGVGEFCTAE